MKKCQGCARSKLSGIPPAIQRGAPIAGITDIARNPTPAGQERARSGGPVIAVIGKAEKQSEQAHRNGDPTGARVPEARYAYYRRCQVFRKNGEQCKAPAKKGASICHAHAGQRAMALRREQERLAVLAEAVADIRGKGRPEFEMADLFMDFESIQVTLAVMARAVIGGRIDCKTAGSLLVHLQMASKLLWMVHREGRKESQISPLICADKRGSSKIGNLPEQRTEVPTTKSTCSIVRSQAKVRSEQASDQEKAWELRIKVVTESTRNAESIKTARTVTIRSPERAQSPFLHLLETCSQAHSLDCVDTSRRVLP